MAAGNMTGEERLARISELGAKFPNTYQKFQDLMLAEGISGIGNDQYRHNRGERAAYNWLLDTFPHALLEDSAYRLACGVATAKNIANIAKDPAIVYIEQNFPERDAPTIFVHKEVTQDRVLEQIVGYLNMFLSHNELERQHVINFEKNAAHYLQELNRGRTIRELPADSIYSMLLDRPVSVREGKAVDVRVRSYDGVMAGLSHHTGHTVRDPDATGSWGQIVKLVENSR
ncbi:hypothetical protein HYV82_06720 [Candidatus Woesearchaeota archaeon]|nr:hypothetical protein [Candidatus Woesearchaeota archaeon]